MMKNILEKSIMASLVAGKAILEVYAMPDFTDLIEMKDDRSPLTLADKRAHEIIHTLLKKDFPEIPMISEEGKSISYSERFQWKKYWLVDPLDGTKEFIKRNGEFTVNIALMENNRPVAGVIYIPVTDTIYAGVVGQGAFKIEEGLQSEIHVRKAPATDRTAVGSRSHSSEDEAKVLSDFKVTDFITTGSSIKFCLVAEGAADLYYRHGPTMEWDTAAGQAILEAAGGKMTNPDGTEFLYNKENMLNGGFLCKGDI
jgi:3'(2'), 5'-bisphosphate nucleotidase